MPLSTYGILRGTVIGHLRDADDDHYQIQVKAGTTVYRIASNVKSSAPNAPSTLLFQSTTTLPDKFTKRLAGTRPRIQETGIEARRARDRLCSWRTRDAQIDEAGTAGCARRRQ